MNGFRQGEGHTLHTVSASTSANPRRDLFRFCACCPSPCRRALQPDAAQQAETVTPSGLAMIALAVIDRHLAYDQAARAALGQTELARQCRTACPYGHDIAGAIESFVAEQDSRP